MQHNTLIYKPRSAHGHGRRAQMRRSYLNSDHVSRYEYNDRGLLHGIFNHAPDTSSINSFTYGYDKAGRRTSMDARDYNASYSYDGLDRLTTTGYSAFLTKPGSTITSAMLPDQTFSYDDNGNRTALLQDPGPGQGSATTTTYAHDAPVNRLTSDGEWAYLFDHNGNMVRKQRISNPDYDYETFHYNFQNKLVNHHLRTPARSVHATYAYDPLGRRILKSISPVGNPSVTQQFAYDGDDARLDFRTTFDTTNYTYKTRLTARYTNGPGVDQPLAIWYDTDGDSDLEPFFYHADALGSITALTSASTGHIAAKYIYDAFGNLAQKCGDPAPTPGRTALADYNRYMYTSREWDGETRLYYYRWRMYEPIIGLFYQEDAIRRNNLYIYVQNSPMDKIDSYGEFELSDFNKAHNPKEYKLLRQAQNEMTCELTSYIVENADELSVKEPTKFAILMNALYELKNDDNKLIFIDIHRYKDGRPIRARVKGPDYERLSIVFRPHGVFINPYSDKGERKHKSIREIKSTLAHELFHFVLLHNYNQSHPESWAINFQKYYEINIMK